MNNLNLQQQITQELLTINPDNLKIIAELVQFIRITTKPAESYPL